MLIHFKGFWQLTKLILRQDRFKILVWLIGLVVVTLAAASAYPDIYPDETARQAFILTVENPAMVAMIGPVSDNLGSNIGTIFAQEMLLFTAIAAMIMSILLVGRSTRVDEEDGRVEMVRSLPVGRLAYLTASTIVLILTNIALALLIGIGLMSLGIDGIDTGSAFLYGSILGAAGLVFGTFASLFAQLAETSRGTMMLSFVALIVAYLIRSVGDVSSEALSLISPLGWTVRTEVFSNNAWWPIWLSVAFAILITFIAFYLNAIRDLDAGFIPQRKGKKHASSLLKTPIGLTLRLQRTNIIAWAVGIFLLSAAFGAILGDLETYYADLEVMQLFLSANPDFSMTEQFIALLIAIMSLIGAIPAIMTVLKLKGEENKNRTEHFYSRTLSRTVVMGNYLILTIIVSFIMQSLIALGLWSVGLTVMEDAIAFGTIYGGALAYIPAILLMVGLALLLIGLLPRATGFVWLYFVYCFIVAYLGELLELPVWMMNLSSLEHVPEILIEDLTLLPILALTAVAGGVTLFGFIFYNKRDLAG